MSNEIARVTDVKFDHCYRVECRECGKEILLWPPGDTDHDECCGFVYSLEYPQLDFVTYSTGDLLSEATS